MSSSASALTSPHLVTLRQRRIEKWSIFDDDVLSLTMAEMDFALAPVIRAAVTDHIRCSDLGYGAGVTVLAEKFIRGGQVAGRYSLMAPPARRVRRIRKA
jgi:bifunctional pyridoxal-dependent enzyme with beta-cystathionase and maltose regulon repressor activities